MDEKYTPALTNTTAYFLLKYIAENKIDFDVCEIFPNSASMIQLQEKLQAMDKTSASPSEVLFGKLVAGAIDGRILLPVSVKMFLDDDKNPDVLGLKYEARVYRKILNEIIDKNYSPNFVSFVGYGCCDNLSVLRMITRTSGKNKNLDRYALKGACITITEKVGNGAYFGLSDSYPVALLGGIFYELPAMDRDKVMFQIIYSLEVLQRYRIVHNDLHANNVLVAIFPDPITLGFQVQEKNFMISTKYIPYLFDWDLAYAESLGDNQKLIGGFEYLNIMNRFSSRADLYTLFCTLEGTRPPGEEHIAKGEKYRQPITVTKEEDKTIYISQEELRGIMQFEPYATYADPVWKFSGNQIRDLLPGKFPDDVTSVMIKAPVPKFHMIFYNLQTHSNVGKSIRLTYQQVEAIRKAGSFTEEKDVPVYKFSRAKLREIGVNVHLDPSDITFTIEEKPVEHPYVTVYNPFQCRITAMSSNFPTPMELLLNDFDEFLVSSEDINSTPFLYNLPNVSASHSIFIDPVYSVKGRKKISGKPRFPPAKSGYVVKNFQEEG